MAQPRVPMAQRFWRHVDRSSDCWVWTGATRRFKSWCYGVTAPCVNKIVRGTRQKAGQ